MTKPNKQLAFLLNLSLISSKLVRLFDTGLQGGLGFSDFVILHHLHQAPEHKLRRVDLAQKVSLTPSGITRLLLPMEKIGLVKREESAHDARVSFVRLAPGGKQLYEEALERANMRAEEFMPRMNITQMRDVSEIFSLFSSLV